MKPKVLIIDDDKLTREIVVNALTKEGYEVQSTESGKVGIEKIKKEDFDVVVLNTKLPDINGITVLSEIKKTKPSIEIILITTHPTIKTVIEGIKKGIFGYFKKPLKIEEVVDSVKKAFLAKKLKSQIFDVKSESMFLSFLSHELKTPIMIISNTLELLLGEAGNKNVYRYSEETRELLEIINRQTQKMQTLVEKIHDFAYMSSDFFVLKEKGCVLNKIIKDAINSIIKFAEDKNIQIIEKLPQQDVVIKCDPEQIERVIVNLLTNAIKYSFAEGRITVSLEERGDEVKIMVEDIGIGIAKENLEKIFEPFYRVKDVNEKGTGLGLAICKKIIELHRGKIWAESEGIGKGSKFIITLPR
jgi:signal transduction histidine kinase